MPERIPDTPENVARTLMNTRHRDDTDWSYLKSSVKKRD